MNKTMNDRKTKGAESCYACKFYKPHDFTADYTKQCLELNAEHTLKLGRCCRHPKWIDVFEEHWCGDFEHNVKSEEPS